ncbi:MAG TPA: hypothetical protein VGZ48_07340 [Candidatus Acidoferrales bacterium]|jgi:hypothetical protein|nr:hypothetical protein [Candidatus Acidoferrales bacterium]
MNKDEIKMPYKESATARIMDAILYGGHVELEKKRLAKAAFAPAIPQDDEPDEQPPEPPSDEDIEGIHKGQTQSEAYRLAH